MRIRQPLRSLSVVIPGGRTSSATLTEILAEELNVKTLVFLTGSDEIVRLSAKPHFGTLGPRFGAQTPSVARAIGSLGADAVRRLRAGDGVELEVDGESVDIRPEEVTILEEATGDLAVLSQNGYLVALDHHVDDVLRAEGMARELVNRVQRLRRDAGLEVTDRIRLSIRGAEAIETAAREHEEYIAGETLALEVVVADEEAGGLEFAEDVEIDNNRATVSVERMTEK